MSAAEKSFLQRARILRWVLALSLVVAAFAVVPRGADGQYFIDLSAKPARMVVFLLPCHTDIDSDGTYTTYDHNLTQVTHTTLMRGWTPRQAITTGIINAIAYLPNNVRYQIYSCAPEPDLGMNDPIIDRIHQPADIPTDPAYQTYMADITSRLSNSSIWRTFPGITGTGMQNWAEMASKVVHDRIVQSTVAANSTFGLRGTLLSPPYQTCTEPTGVDIIYLGPTPPTADDAVGMAWPNNPISLTSLGLPHFDFTACYELNPTQPWQTCGPFNDDLWSPNGDAIKYDNCSSCRRKFNDVFGHYDLVVWANRPETLPPPALFPDINEDSETVLPVAATVSPVDYELDLWWLNEYNLTNFPNSPASGPAEDPLAPTAGDCSSNTQCCSDRPLSGPYLYPCPALNSAGNPTEDCINGIDDDGDFMPDCYDEDCSQRGHCGGMIIINNCQNITADGGVDAGDLIEPQNTPLPVPEFEPMDVPEELLEPQDSLVGKVLRAMLGIADANAQWGAENNLPTCHDGQDNDLLLFGLQSNPPQWDCDDTYLCHEKCNECRDGRDNDFDGVVDCQDNECFDSPYCLPGYTPEVCGDGIDNDGFGLIDCADPDCACTAACGADGGIYSVPAGGPGNAVGGTGYVDPVSGINCGDPSVDATSGYCRCLPDCITYWTTGSWSDIDGDGDDDTHTGHVNVANQGLEVCDDKFVYDEDCDGLVNCLDPDCCTHPHCNSQDIFSGCNSGPEPCAPAALCGGGEDCFNGVDDDGDGFADCQDSDCFCIEICDDGIDNDGNGFLDCADPECGCHPACLQPDDCSGLSDLDCDGLVGCDDPDCQALPICNPCTAKECCMDIAHTDNVAYWSRSIVHEHIPNIVTSSVVSGDWVNTHGIFYHRRWFGGATPTQVPLPDTGDPLERSEYTWYTMLSHTANVGGGLFYEAWDATSVRNAILNIVNRTLPGGNPLGETNPVVVRADDRLFKSWWEAFGDNASVYTGHLEAWQVDTATGDVVGTSALWDAATELGNRDYTVNTNQSTSSTSANQRRVFVNFAEDDFYSPPLPLDKRITDGVNPSMDRAARIVPLGTVNPTFEYWTDTIANDVTRQDAQAVVEYARGNELETQANYVGRSRGTSKLGSSFRTRPVHLPSKYSLVTDRPGLAAFLRFLSANTESMVALTGNDGALHVFRASDGVELFGYVPGVALDYNGSIKYGQSLSNTVHGLMQTGAAPVNDGQITVDLVWMDGYSNGLAIDGQQCPTAGYHSSLADGLDSGPSSDPSFSGPDGCEWHRVMIVSAGRGGKYIYGLDISGVGLNSNTLIAPSPNATTGLGQHPYFLFELHNFPTSNIGTGIKVAQAALTQIWDPNANGGNGLRRWTVFYPEGTAPYARVDPDPALHAALHAIPLSPDQLPGSYHLAIDSNADGVSDVADSEIQGFHVRGYNADDAGHGVLAGDVDSDAMSEYLSNHRGSLWGTPALVDVTGDKLADLAYVGDRAGVMYKILIDDPDDPANWTSCPLTVPPLNDSSGSPFGPEELALYYSPAVSYDASGNLHVFYGSGSPLNALGYDRGLFYSVVDPAPESCAPQGTGPGGTSVAGTPGCTGGDYFLELLDFEKVTGAPVAAGGVVVFSTLGSLLANDFDDYTAVPFCPGVGLTTSVPGWIHVINFQCQSAIWDPSSDPNGYSFPPGVQTQPRGGGYQAIQVAGVPSAPDLVDGQVYVGQHGSGRPLNIRVGAQQGGSSEATFKESFITAFRQTY
jgi:hypothetical protein